jgi:hypothetical protein
MRIQRQQSVTRMFLVLAMVLASLWAGGLAVSAMGDPADQLAASRPLPGIESAILRDRLPALGALVERPGPSGRLVPVLLGMLVAVLAVVYGVCAGRLRSGRGRVRSLVQFTQREARAPPLLQPA